MATFETRRLARQAVDNLVGLRRDMRANASAYKAHAQSAKKPLEDIVALMHADGAQYLKRLRWMKDIFDAGGRKTKLVDGLVAEGLSESQAVAEYTTLKAIADEQAGISVATYADVETAADELLGALPAYDSVWPE